MAKYLVFDISNMLYRTFFVETGENDVTLTGLATHMALNTLNKYYKKFKPDKVIFACDRSNWRKLYTKSKICVSGKIYKGDRNKDLTQSQQEKLDKFREHLDEFETLIRKHSSIVVLAADGCEADDMIAGFVDEYHADNEIVIVSRDKDFVQFLRHPTVKLMDPTTEKYRTLDEWDYDADLHLFIKCIRANEDNIQCAFPRVRETRLRKAYEDPFEMTNLMEHKWTDHNGKEFKVGDLYKENVLLMDLRKQPPTIKNIMKEVIQEEMENPGRYSHFHFLAFCGKYQLKRVSHSIDNFLGLLSS